MTQNDNGHNRERRRFLRQCGLSALGGILVCSQPLTGDALANTLLKQAPLPLPVPANLPSLILRNIHTGEDLTCTLGGHGPAANGSYDGATLAAINHLMRDHRTGDVHAIDPALLSLMTALAARLQVDPVFHIISGYRTARTNQSLRQKSRNVATKSYHLLGQAADLRIPGVEVTRLHRAALDLKLGGVGMYQGPGFVHVDTGPVRTW